MPNFIDPDWRERERNDAWAAAEMREADLRAADKVRKVLTPAVRKVLEEAWKLARSNEGCDALVGLLDDTLPAIDAWMDSLED